MKKKYMLLSALLFVFVAAVSYYAIVKYRYEKNYAHIDNHYFAGAPSISISKYYDIYNRIPEHLSDAAFEGMDMNGYFYYWNREVKDWLSREPEEYPSFSYYRVYDRSTKEAVGFVILSTGIDGKTNVTFSANDTLYTDDYLMKIGVENLYNPYNYYENSGNVLPVEELMPKFNLKDYFFGKKDLLLMYGNPEIEKAYHDNAIKELNEEALRREAEKDSVKDSLTVKDQTTTKNISL